MKVANDISRERGFSVAENISPQNKKEIRDAAYRVLKGMSCYTFDVFKTKMEKEGFAIQKAYSKSGKLQGYYILSKSGTPYKASVIDRNLTLGRIENTWRLIRSGRYRHAETSYVPNVTRQPSQNGSHSSRSSLSPILNARVTHGYSSNREDEVNRHGYHYDDEESEQRSRGYKM